MEKLVYLVLGVVILSAPLMVSAELESDALGVSEGLQAPDAYQSKIQYFEQVFLPSSRVYEIMKEKKIEWNIPFDYLHDASQEIAKAYKAQCTPDLYLLKNTDGAWKLFYHGRINDNWQDPTAVQEKNLEDVLADLVGDKEPPKDQKPSMGCSIKWKK